MKIMFVSVCFPNKPFLFFADFFPLFSDTAGQNFNVLEVLSNVFIDTLE